MSSGGGWDGGDGTRSLFVDNMTLTPSRWMAATAIVIAPVFQMGLVLSSMMGRCHR